LIDSLKWKLLKTLSKTFNEEEINSLKGKFEEDKSFEEEPNILKRMFTSVRTM